MGSLINAGTSARATPRGIEGDTIVTPPVATTAVFTVGVVAAAGTFLSAAVDMGAVYTRECVIAMVYDAAQAAESGQELEILWSATVGGVYVPSPAAERTSPTTSKVVSAGTNPIVARGIPLGRFVKVRFKAGATATTATLMLYVQASPEM
jgi:hypothetical protein